MRTCCVSDKNVCEGISYIRFCFYFIGNTVIHSCVKVELSYEIKNILSFLIYAIMDILNQALPDLA